MSRKYWLLSAGVAALAVPGIAHAQDDPAAAQTTDAAAAQPAAQEGENDIVVTAQGRRQILQDVPLAVTAVGGEAMQNSGATDIRQLNQLAPSLMVSSTGTEANGSARIRGIGTVGDNPGLESSVAVFIDGVYRSRSGVGLNELGEIERVEVLRGPQGTLFGRNASAGLIHVIIAASGIRFRRRAPSCPMAITIIYAASWASPARSPSSWPSGWTRSTCGATVSTRSSIPRARRKITSTIAIASSSRGQLLFEPSDALDLSPDRRLFEAERILLRRGLSRPGDEPPHRRSQQPCGAAQHGHAAAGQWQ